MRTVEFVIAVLLLELTPGPNMAYLAALSLTRGRRAALAGVVGVALGLVAHAVLSALGMGVLVADSPLVYEALRWAGVAFMLFLAGRAPMTACPRRQPPLRPANCCCAASSPMC